MPKAEVLNTPIENQLLAALSPELYKHLLPLLEPVSLAVGDVLYQPYEVIRFVYFPHQSMISIINILQDNTKVEMAVIGSEGMVGTTLISGDDTSPHQAIVQIADGGVRMTTAAFKKEFRQNLEFRALVLRFSQTQFVQVAQTAACNTLHPIVQRLARWLLMAQDRRQSDTLELTHDFLATMLGVQRAGVTIAAGSLQKAGLIKYRRGKVTILRRQELEAAACECYATVKAEATRLFDNQKIIKL
jgi:CRP-like cAMP-binding protein